jgi:hypothetical protein
MKLRLSAPLKNSMTPVSYAELKVIPPPPDKLFPIRGDLLADMVFDYVASVDLKVTDTFYGASKDGNEFYGLFSVGPHNDSDFEWIIGITNDNSSGGGIVRGSFEAHSGVSFPFVGNAMSFSKTVKIAEKKCRIDKDDLRSLVNENLTMLREYFNLEYERESIFKARKLKPEEASHIIMQVIERNVMAGRLISEFLDEWRNPKFEYLKPRTLWSLFVQCAWFLNRLQAPILIDRTVMLHHLFDEIAKFNKKPTKWVQSTFA